MRTLDSFPHTPHAHDASATRVIAGGLRRRAAGFTLVEVMLVMAVTGILTTIAVPVLNRARAASIEVSTIGSLRTLNSAQATYASSCAGGFYAPSTTWLATSGGVGKAAFIGAEFPTNTTDRLGYRIRFTAGPVAAGAPKTCNGLAAGKAVQSYFIAADLIQVTLGTTQRYFGTNSNATIFQSTKRINAFYSGTPPAPATPIK